MTLLAAVSQVKCAAATIILMPACQNASATKCCCQPRGLISLARVPLIITCHYQFWLHLLTRLSVAARLCMCYVCIHLWVCRTVGPGVYILATEHRPQPVEREKQRVHRHQLSMIPMYLYAHIYGERQEGIKHRSLFSGVYQTYLVKVAVDYSQDNCISGADLSAVRLYRCIVKAEGSRASWCQTAS